MFASLTAVDKLFGFGFLTVAVLTFIGLTVITANLHRNIHSDAIYNCMMSRRAIGALFVLFIIPAFYFAAKGFPFAGACTMILAGVASYSTDRLSNRAHQILIQRHYI